MPEHIREVEAEIALEAEKPYNAADAQQVNNARKKAGRKRVNRLEVVKQLMEVKEGRAWMYDLLGKCGTFTAPCSDSPHRDAQAAGRQMVGHWLQADIMSAAPEQYWVMVKEARSDN